MITQSCNLSCQGCTNYSDIRHAGYVSWKQGETWLKDWLQRIDILDFGIMGGEPFINPQWRAWVQGVRNLMPKAQIRFTTNGLLIVDHIDLLDFFEHIGNMVFKISVHVDHAPLEQTISNIQQARAWEPVDEYGIKRWKTNNNLRLQINRPRWFYKTHRGDYSNMQPHHNTPVEAFEACVQQTCPLLYQGEIYKCSTSALNWTMLQRFNNPYMQQWQPYLQKGLHANCTESELDSFVANFGKPHSICGQCPSRRDLDSKLDHRITVAFK